MAISLHNSAVSTPGGSASLASGALTASIGEIIVVQIEQEIPSGAALTVSSISDGTANVYHKRFSASQVPDPMLGASEGFEVWWAYAASALVAATITVTMSGAVDDAVLIVGGYQGFTGTAYQTAPWDTNASLPATAQGHSNSAASILGVSTTSTAGMLLFGVGSIDSGIFTTPPTGFTLVQGTANTGGINECEGSLFDKVYSSAQSSITITTPQAQTGWIAWADALTIPAGGGGSVASSSGTGTASAVGSSTATSISSAIGTGAATGVGKSTATSVGSSPGTGAATAVGRSTATSVGTSSGTGTANGVAISTATSVASSTGVSVTTGIAVSTATSIGTSSGAGTATGITVSTAASVGTSSGVGIATGVGSSSGGGSAGTVVGTGTATGVGKSTATAVGTISGSGIATGIAISTATSVGTSSGVGAAAAIGLGSTASIGTTSGAGTATGVTISTAISIGTSSGIGTVSAVGTSSSTSAVGISVGIGVATGVTAVTVSSVGTASGFSAVLAFTDNSSGFGGKTYQDAWNKAYKKLAEHQVQHSTQVKQAAAVLSKMGGHARAASLTAKQRTNIASMAAKARWK